MMAIKGQGAPSSRTIGVSVTVGGKNLGTFVPTGRIIVYGGPTTSASQSDSISIDPSITLPAWLYGGDGPGFNLLIGGSGGGSIDATDERGEARPGAGFAASNNIEVAGSTVYDDNQLALNAIMNEWTNRRMEKENGENTRTRRRTSMGEKRQRRDWAQWVRAMVEEAKWKRPGQVGLRPVPAWKATGKTRSGVLNAWVQSRNRSVECVEMPELGPDGTFLRSSPGSWWAMRSPEYPGRGSMCEKWVVCGFSHMSRVICMVTPGDERTFPCARRSVPPPQANSHRPARLPPPHS
jgi:hypothetical protein